MSTGPVMVFTSFFGVHVNAANIGVGFKNPDGSFNVSGTVIGLGQTAHSAVDFTRTGVTTVSKWMPGIGAAFGAVSALDSFNKIEKAQKAGQSPAQSDIAGVLGGVAAFAGGIALILGGGVIVPVSLVVGVAAGTWQMVASAKGWTVDDALSPIEKELSNLQKAEVDQALQHHSVQSVKSQMVEQQQLNKFLNNLFPLTGEFEQQDAMCTKLQSQFKTALTVAIDPLVLDLDGDGVETTTLSKTTIGGVNFNLDAKGLAEKTGWVGKDDGLLVRDLDGDGQITSGRELFGNHALLQSGKAAAHGFEALKELDSNADGVVDAKDSAFGSLRVWKDADSDGVTDAGELLTLDEAGVKSLKVGYSNANTIDAQGNAHRQLGSFTTTAGATRAMNDVWFGVDTARTVDQDVVAVSANIAALPELAGNDAHWRLAA